MGFVGVCVAALSRCLSHTRWLLSPDTGAPAAPLPPHAVDNLTATQEFTKHGTNCQLYQHSSSETQAGADQVTACSSPSVKDLPSAKMADFLGILYPSAFKETWLR